MSYAQILDRWPTLADLARDIGAPLATVRSWRRRDSIPAHCWDAVIWAARKRRLRGVSQTSMMLAQRARSKATRHAGRR